MLSVSLRSHRSDWHARAVVIPIAIGEDPNASKNAAQNAAVEAWLAEWKRSTGAFGVRQQTDCAFSEPKWGHVSTAVSELRGGRLKQESALRLTSRGLQLSDFLKGVSHFQ